MDEERPWLPDGNPPDPDSLPGWSAARAVDLGTLVVVVHSNDDRLLRRFDDLLSAFPEAPPALDRQPAAGQWRGPHDGLGVVDLRLACFGPRPDDTVSREQVLVVVGQEPRALTSRRRAEDLTLAIVNRLVLTTQPDLLHLHAGLVSQQGRAVLLVGPSGSGKSTLTAQLVRSGWSYHTDEMVGIAPDSGALLSYPRPPTLKPGSWSLFADLPSVAAADADDDMLDRVHLPPGELGAATWSEPHELALIAFVRHTGHQTVETMTPSEAVVQLVADTLDLERAGTRGMDALVRMAAQTLCVRMDTATPQGAVDVVGRLVRETASPPAPSIYERLGPGPEGWRRLERWTAADELVARRPLVHSWSLTDGTIAYDVATGRVARFDPWGGAIMARLDGSTPVDEVIQSIADQTGAATDEIRLGIGTFLDQLASVGLLAAPRGEAPT